MGMVSTSKFVRDAVVYAYTNLSTQPLGVTSLLNGPHLFQKFVLFSDGRFSLALKLCQVVSFALHLLLDSLSLFSLLLGHLPQVGHVLFILLGLAFSYPQLNLLKTETTMVKNKGQFLISWM